MSPSVERQAIRDEIRVKLSHLKSEVPSSGLVPLWADAVLRLIEIVELLLAQVESLDVTRG